MCVFIDVDVVDCIEYVQCCLMFELLQIGVDVGEFWLCVGGQDFLVVVVDYGQIIGYVVFQVLG